MLQMIIIKKYKALDLFGVVLSQQTIAWLFFLTFTVLFSSVLPAKVYASQPQLPVMLEGDEPLKRLPLTMVRPATLLSKAMIAPSTILLPDFVVEQGSESLFPHYAQQLRWYRLDLQATQDEIDVPWRLVFQSTPHKQLDVLMPVNGEYRLITLRHEYDSASAYPLFSRSSRLSKAPQEYSVPILLQDQQITTLFIRHHQDTVTGLEPTLWREAQYLQHIDTRYTTLHAMQALLIVSLLVSFSLLIKQRTAAHYLLTLHTLLTFSMAQLWQGGFAFNTVPMHDTPYWLAIMTHCTIVSGLLCQHYLDALATRHPNTDRIMLTCASGALALLLLGHMTPSGYLLQLIALTLISISLTVLAIARIYDACRGIRSARLTLPSLLMMMATLTYTNLSASWPSYVIDYPALVLLSLHGALMLASYWYTHAGKPNVTGYRAYEGGADMLNNSVLQQHFQVADMPITESAIHQRVLTTFNEVLPKLPASLVHYYKGQWQIGGKYTKAARNLQVQLPSIEWHLLAEIQQRQKSNIRFKDRFGAHYWLFLLSAYEDNLSLLLLSPSQRYRKNRYWQMAADICGHGRALFDTYQQSQQWQQQAQLDSLTGLLNRQSFLQAATEIVEAAKNDATDSTCALLFIDIDHFKSWNDRYGHAEGDKAILIVTNICRLYLRQEDLLCRYGGEEFVVLLPNTDAYQAYQIAEHIRTAIAPEQTSSQIMLDALNGFDVTVSPELTVSIGVAALNRETESLVQLIEQSDAAMYQAKVKGRNRSVIFDVQLSSVDVAMA